MIYIVMMINITINKTFSIHELVRKFIHVTMLLNEKEYQYF